MASEMTLIQQLRGRAAFLRDKGRIKSPGLMEQAANALESHLAQPAQAVDVSDAVVSMAVEAWNAAPALGREEDDDNAMRAAIETALSALSVPAMAVTNALAEKVLTAYATICIDRHHDDAPESARISAMREALTRALSGEKAGPAGDGLVLVGYCHRDDAERLMDRKDQSHHTFTAVEVWNKRSDFYRTPVHIALPASPTPDKEGES